MSGDFYAVSAANEATAKTCLLLQAITKLFIQLIKKKSKMTSALTVYKGHVMTELLKITVSHPPSFIHQVIIIPGLDKLYEVALKIALDAMA